MKIITIKKRLKVITGLHIGGGDDSMKIGGADSLVIKREVFVNKANGKLEFPQYKTDENGKKTKDLVEGFRRINEPYIAGSSLKGKIRSLLEHNWNLINPSGNGEVVDSSSKYGDTEKKNLIVKFFGESASEKNKDNKTITRFIFRDIFISDDVREAFINEKIKLTEIKAENVINRKTGTAEHPRFIERVLSGIEFDFEISIRIFDDKEEKTAKEILELGLSLLESDALGGSGSRGYGQVKFFDLEDNTNATN